MHTMLGVQVVAGVVAVVALLLTLNAGGWRERLSARRSGTTGVEHGGQVGADK